MMDHIANATVTEEGIGPCRAIVANYDPKCTAEENSIQDASSIDDDDNLSTDFAVNFGNDKGSSGDKSFIAFLEFLKNPSIQIDPKAESNIDVGDNRYNMANDVGEGNDDVLGKMFGLCRK